MLIQICVGSSCHIKGAPDIVELLKKSVEENGLQDTVTLAGNFCIGKCNRYGVTVQIDDNVYTGITVENFKEFFNDKVLAVINKEEE